MAFNNEFVRIQTISETMFASKFDLYPLNEKYYLMCVDFMDQKKAFKIDRESNLFADVNDSTYMVMGHPCNKATGKNRNGDVVVFYTKEFGVNFFPHGNLPGFPLKYVVNAISMQSGTLPQGIFDLARYDISRARKKRDLDFITGRKMSSLKLKSITGEKRSLNSKVKRRS